MYICAISLLTFYEQKKAGCLVFPVELCGLCIHILKVFFAGTGAIERLASCRWRNPVPCITTAIWPCHNPFSQWQRSFQWKLRSHRLKVLRRIWVKSITTIPQQNTTKCQLFNTLRPRQNGRHFPDDIFKHIFLNENVGISIQILLKFVP